MFNNLNPPPRPWIVIYWPWGHEIHSFDTDTYARHNNVLILLTLYLGAEEKIFQRINAFLSYNCLVAQWLERLL